MNNIHSYYHREHGDIMYNYVLRKIIYVKHVLTNF